MFQRKYVGEEEWHTITRKLAVERLSDWYVDVPAILKDMETGRSYRTAFAEYRMVADTARLAVTRQRR
mgnify:CR=1 FL=1